MAVSTLVSVSEQMKKEVLFSSIEENKDKYIEKKAKLSESLNKSKISSQLTKYFEDERIIIHLKFS